MQALVVNGEPVVFGDPWGPNEFRRLANQATGDEEEESKATHDRIQAIWAQSHNEKLSRSDRLAMKISESSFRFVADECCHEFPLRHWDRPTITVLKKDRWGNVHFGQKAIGGCRCRGCDDLTLHSTWTFLREKTGVRFNI